MAAPPQKAPASGARLRRGCDPAERRHSGGYDVAFLLDRLREAGADDQAAALASRAAAHAALGHPGAVARLLRSLREAGAREQAATLAGRLPLSATSDTRSPRMSYTASPTAWTRT
jgi:hypothetical protein